MPNFARSFPGAQTPNQSVPMMLKETVNRAFESPFGEGLLRERRTLHGTLGRRRQGAARDGRMPLHARAA